MASSSTFSVLFLGTGVSTAVPNIQHIINPPNPMCAVCSDAFTGANSKNKRNNVSIAMLFKDEEDKQKCVVIDVGKTMRDGCMKLFPANKVSEVHGIIITHGHADAIFGLDDVRDLQISKTVEVPDATKGVSIGFKIVSGSLPVYLHQETMDVVDKCFGYLVQKPAYLDEANCILERRVALLDFNVIDTNASFNVSGLPVRSFPVYHGGKYVSLGFSIGKAGEFVYISDVKIIPEETMTYLKSLPRIKVFVIDALNWVGIFPHMGVDEALEVVKILQPEQTYFVGMSCSIGLHDEVNAKLAAMEGPKCELAFDGLKLDNFEMN